MYRDKIEHLYRQHRLELLVPFLGNCPQDTSPSHLFYKAMVKKDMGDFDEAKITLNQLLTVLGLPKALRGEIHYQLGDIHQYLGYSWMEDMVACLAYVENHFRAVWELNQQFRQEVAESSSITRERTPRIIMVLGSNPATVAFCNYILAKLPLVGLIQQFSHFPILHKRHAPKEGSLPFGLSEQEARDFQEETVLENCWNALYLEEDISRLFVGRGEINSDWVRGWIQTLKPDLFIVHGPERLKPSFIELAPFGGINVHWGLSPEYRGMHTARWPLIQQKPEWIGLTIHLLDSGLDSGPILYQAKPALVKGDTFRMIEYRLTMLACEIVPYAVREVLEGKARPTPQDLNVGRQYWNSQWSPAYERMLTSEYINQQIQHYQDEKEMRDRPVLLINPWKPGKLL